ncbi:MAG: hypothetical protein H0U10_14170 [Chloroflexia bacterium]|nr:hypothetical protein [Chloroflexia bacterium]
MADEPTDEPIEALLRQGADRERRLLRRERRAEQDVAALRAKLGDDEARLERARRRAERCRTEVTKAEEFLRRRQADRATGPPVAAAPDAS